MIYPDVSEKDEILKIPILRIKKSEYKKILRNRDLQYIVNFKINKDETITIINSNLCVLPYIEVPGFTEENKDDTERI